MTTVEDYTDLHRATLQTMSGYGTVEETQFKTIFESIWKNYSKTEVPGGELDKTVDSINKKISSFDQKIIKYHYGLNSLQYYCFISTAKTSISKMQNVYNEQELDYFKLIINKIIGNTEVFITPRDALNISSEVPKKLLKIRAQVLLDKWLCSHYFFKNTDDKIYLGPKILNEFKELFQGQEIEYIKSCSLCDDIAIWGTRCYKCNTIFHDACIQKFIVRSTKCPSCKDTFANPML